MRNMIDIEIYVEWRIPGASYRGVRPLLRKLETYWMQGVTKDDNKYFYYSLPEDHELLRELLDLESKTEHMSVYPLSSWVDFSEDESKQFEAYIPVTLDDRACFEFSGSKSIYDICDVCHGNLRFTKSVMFNFKTRDWNGKSFGEKRIVDPRSMEDYLNFAQDKKEVFMCCPDEWNIFMVTPELHDCLIEDGFPKSLFRAAVSKEGNIMGYEFVADAELPSNALGSDRFTGGKTCVKCGRRTYDNQITHFQYDPVLISKDNAEKIGTVTSTFDLFPHHPLILFSNDLRRAIAKHTAEIHYVPVQISKEAAPFE